MNWVDGSSGDSYNGIYAYIHWKTLGGSKLVVLFENMCKQPGEDDSLAPELKLFPYLAIQSLNGDYQLLVLNYLYAQRLFLERVLVFCHSFQDIVIEIREAQTIAVCYWSTCH